MINMDYCKWENTLKALQQCNEDLHEDLDEDEATYRKYVIRLCRQMAEDAEQSFEDVS